VRVSRPAHVSVPHPFAFSAKGWETNKVRYTLFGIALRRRAGQQGERCRILAQVVRAIQGIALREARLERTFEIGNVVVEQYAGNHILRRALAAESSLVSLGER